MLKKLSFEPARLSTNKGPLIRENTGITSRKDKKRKGRVRGRIIHPSMKWSEIYEEGLDPEEYWDDWRDHRDSYRDTSNLKLKGKIRRQNLIRRARKKDI